MKIKSTLFSLFLVLAFLIVPVKDSWAGGSELDVVESDGLSEGSIVAFFDLRNRETYIQVTNIPDDTGGGGAGGGGCDISHSDI